MKRLLPLVILLFFIPLTGFAQEVFVFDSIPNPATVTAGDSFYVHITCTSNPTFNGAGQLSLRPNPGYNPLQPDPSQWIIFNNGGWGGYVTIFMASDSLHLNCNTLGYNDTNLSGQFIVLPGIPQRLRLLLPGQPSQPGWLPSRGRQNILYVETANVPFTINVTVCDYWWNPVNSGQDTMSFSSTNPFPVLPADTALAGGTLDASVRLRTAMNACTIFVQEMTAGPSPLMEDTSSTIRILPGGFSKLLLLAPSQTVLAGDTETNNTLLPGATPDTADWQITGTPFDITVYAVDDCWNPVGGTAPQDTVRVYGTIQIYTLADTTVLTGGQATVTFTSTVSGDLLLQAEDLSNPSMVTAYWTPVKIAGSRYRLVADEEDSTIVSGSNIHLHIYYEDENGHRITNDDHDVVIYVFSGSGSLAPSDSVVRTLSSGMVEPTVQYSTNQAEDLYLRVSPADPQRRTAPGTNVDPIHVIPTVAPGGREVTNFPNPFGYDQDWTTIYYWLESPCDVVVSIYDRFGNLVKSWPKASRQTGANYLTWDGKNNRGVRVANGAYLLAIRATSRTAIVHDYRRWIAVVK